jgi:hypothetical protein
MYSPVVPLFRTDAGPCCKGCFHCYEPALSGAVDNSSVLTVSPPFRFQCLEMSKPGTWAGSLARVRTHKRLASALRPSRKRFANSQRYRFLTGSRGALNCSLKIALYPPGQRLLDRLIGEEGGEFHDRIPIVMFLGCTFFHSCRAETDSIALQGCAAASADQQPSLRD